VAGLTSLLYTARDALTAQSYGLDVTGQNIANANTPGYVRRQVVLQTTAFGNQTTGSVQVGPLQRPTDAFLDDRRYESTGLSSSAGEEDNQLANVQSLFNDTTSGGISTSLDALFSSFSALSASPNDSTTRQSVLSNAANFASQLNDTANSIAQQKTDIVTEAQGVAVQINQDTTDIAKLNQQIATATAAGQDAADLKDQLGTKVQDLSTFINVHTFTDNQGNLVVQGGGTTLVQGDVASTLSVGLATDGTMQFTAQSQAGSSTDITSYVTGGKLAGLKQARDTDLTQVGQELDQFAYDVATAVNTQHAAGAGLDGVSGRNLFAIGASATDAARTIAVDPSIAGQPNNIAASSSSASLPGGSDNAVALAALANQSFAGGGTRTASEAYSDVLGDVAQRKANSANAVSLRGDVDAQVKTMQQSQSGVSLDEEMVNLTSYQRAYEAATKVLTTADQLLGELMSSVTP
jgi:flagellar hook-associated protein 1 FlgK